MNTIKLWQLKIKDQENPFALAKTWDHGQAIAKRFDIQEFTLVQVYVTIEEVPLEEINNSRK